MTTEFYSTVDEVIRRTGVQAKDLGWEEEDSGADEELADFLEGLLIETADLMNRKLSRNYLTLFDAGTITEIPPGLNGIAADVASDSIRTMIVTRQTPVVRIDDFAVATLRARVFSPDILDRLRLYGGGGMKNVELSNR